VNVDIDKLVPGQFGVSHGSGLGGEIIRHATASWAGHAFIYVGSGMLVEAVSPATHIAPANIHDDAIWAYRMPITATQSGMAVARAHALVGRPYDWPAYIGFTLSILKLANGQQLDEVFAEDHWRVCSADIVDCYGYAEIPLNFVAAKITPAGNNINLISPANLLDLATVNGWV